MKKPYVYCLFIAFSLSIYVSNINAFFNMGYVGVNNQSLMNIRCFVNTQDNQPFFSMASIFAANINGENPDDPVLYFNPQVSATLKNQKGINQLKSEGIKVLLSVLGNHQNAGWSCFTNEDGAKKFADELVNAVIKYNLDGIDIDDEYSTCSGNNTSMIMVAGFIKQNPKFEGKLLTKVLWQDLDIFNAHYNDWKLGSLLDYGWGMNYGSGVSQLSPYLEYMSKNKLALGVNPANNDSPDQNAFQALSSGYGGIMVFTVKNSSVDYVEKLAKGQKQSVVVLPNCIDTYVNQ